MNASIIMFGDVNITLLITDRISTERVSKDREEPTPHQGTGSNLLSQNTSSKNSRIHILFKCQGTVTKIDHILGHKINLKNWKLLKDIPEDSGLKLEIHNKKWSGKSCKYLEN